MLSVCVRDVTLRYVSRVEYTLILNRLIPAVSPKFSKESACWRYAYNLNMYIPK